MASIENLTKMLEIMDIGDNKYQSLMLRGIHGIGKSEFIRDYFEAQGYRVVVLMLGQLADNADLLGLPKYKELEDGTTVTEFTRPDWWPRDEDEKVLLFLDEFNRANNPELHAAAMDLTLNRKLAGKSLPSNCRIAAAINPAHGDEHSYDTTILDPALLDRFNVYEFTPTEDEWLEWAKDNGVHDMVIKFIDKHRSTYLDPPTGEQYKPDMVYPSRRSWVRVSNIINSRPEILQDEDLCGVVFKGIVGTSATSRFNTFIKTHKDAIGADDIVKSWHEDSTMRGKIKNLEITHQDSLNRELMDWWERFVNIDGLHAVTDEDIRKQYASNMGEYLNTIEADSCASFFERLSEIYNDTENKKRGEWVKALIRDNESIGTRMVQMLKQRIR